MAWAQPAPAASGEAPLVGVDPIRCWCVLAPAPSGPARPFSLDLTCAVLENEAVSVVPDESRLGGRRRADGAVRDRRQHAPAGFWTGQRRFFQVPLFPAHHQSGCNRERRAHSDLTIQYRVNSRLPGNASLQGRYFLSLFRPSRSASSRWCRAMLTDVRDAAGESFGGAESLAFRARAPQDLSRSRWSPSARSWSCSPSYAWRGALDGRKWWASV